MRVDALTGVAFVDRYTRREGTVKGRYVVLSASAIETARLLLNSKSSLFPLRLANSSGEAGRQSVEDCVASVSGHLRQLEGREATNDDSYQPYVLLQPNVNVDEKTRSKNFLRRYLLRCAGGSFGFEASGHGMGPELKADARRSYGTNMVVVGSGCGLEDPNNYADIDSRVNDAWGIPAVRIHLKHGANQDGFVKDVVSRGVELIEAAGGMVQAHSLTPSIPGAQIHEQGTCRMGDDAKMTNRWGQCHDVPNLILADGSIHCTSGTTDPTITILALTMRNATHLADEVKKRNI